MRDAVDTPYNTGAVAHGRREALPADISSAFAAQSGMWLNPLTAVASVATALSQRSRQIVVAGPVMVNRAMVASDIIDGEVVMINFDTGSYYSLGGAGASIWALLAEPASVPDIAAAVAAEYDGDASEIAASVERLVSELLEEGLVTPAHLPSAPGDAVAAGQATAPAVRPRFQPPALQRYTDMQDLLMLDPIHEVDESGWPERR